MGSRKSGAIEFWRFFFSVGVAIMHFGYYNGFYIAVDFFFLLSGFLTAKTVERHPEKGVWSIALSKWMRLWPEYVLAYVLTFVARLIRTPERISINRVFVADAVLELLGLQIMSPMSTFVNSISWYISAMMVCTPLIVWLYQKYRYTFTHIIAPYGALAIYAFFWYNWGHIDFAFVWLGTCNGGLLRGLADLMLGCALYEAFRILSAKGRLPKRGLSATGFCCSLS